MTGNLYSKGISIFDYPRFVEQYREALRENAEKLAKENGIEIEFVKNSKARKEDKIKKAAAKNRKKERKKERRSFTCIISNRDVLYIVVSERKLSV